MGEMGFVRALNPRGGRPARGTPPAERCVHGNPACTWPSRVSRRRGAASLRRALVVAAAFGAAALTSAQGFPEREAWYADLAFLAQTIRERHPEPYRWTSAVRFDEIVAQARGGIAAAASRAEAELELARVAAAVGDGHTNVRPWERYALLPLRWAWFGDELRVTAAPAAQRELLGLRVATIGALPLATARARVQAYIAQHESPAFERNWSPYLLRMAEVLAGIGGARSGEPVVVGFLDEAGTPRRVALVPVSRADDAATPLTRPYATPPLSARAPDEPFWFERSEGTGVVYVSFAGYPARERFVELAQRLVHELEAPGVTAVLFDLRQNGGGDLKLGRRFIEFVRPTIVKRALRVYVAIGRGTYSAGMANATDFRKAFGATYVGETSGARPNGFQESGAFVLPASGLPGSVAREYYRFQEVDTDGLVPDVPVPWTWGDYAAGVDAVIAYVTGAERDRTGREGAAAAPAGPR